MTHRYRIGIFDPAFTKEGHFIAFDRYIASLLDNPKYQAVFLDVNGEMRSVYCEASNSENAPQFHLIAVSERAPRMFGTRIGNFILRMRRWRSIYEAIANADLDLVLITSESYDPLMYLYTPRFTYALLILNPRLYVFVPPASSYLRGILSRFFARRYRLLAKNASALVTTSEPPLIEDLEYALALRSLFWLPNLPLAPVHPPNEPFSFDFITIGTISKSKSHLFALSAFEANSLPYRYLIAGLARDSVGRKVEEEVDRLQKKSGLSIRGEFGYIDEHSYDQLLRSARFTLFPYDFARGNISSQVMHDSFQRGIPIIAPDIQPFKWYVERYGVGLLYKEGDADSLAEAIRKAHEFGRMPFMSGFSRLAYDHSLENISVQFDTVLMTALKKSRVR